MLLRGGDSFFQRIPPLGLIRRHACRRHRPSRFSLIHSFIWATAAVDELAFSPSSSIKTIYQGLARRPHVYSMCGGKPIRLR